MIDKLQAFVSFDVEHDGELYERLLAQSRTPGFGFTVAGGSEAFAGGEGWSERTRRLIREADQVIIICGEHTRASAAVRAELQIAQQEQVPYFLLWGRREAMCTRPTGAKPADPMYSWTQRILQDRINVTARKLRSQAESAAVVAQAAAKD